MEWEPGQRTRFPLHRQRLDVSQRSGSGTDQCSDDRRPLRYQCLAGTAVSGSGFDGNDPEEILHFNDNRWVREQTDLANARLFALALLSTTQGWAVGSLRHGSGSYASTASSGGAVYPGE